MTAAPRSRLTKAQERAMGKVLRAGRVRFAGGYGGDMPPDRAIESADFDRREPLERLIARGLCKPGLFANTVEPTAEGLRAFYKLAENRARQAAAQEAAREAAAAGRPPPRTINGTPVLGESATASLPLKPVKEK